VSKSNKKGAAVYEVEHSGTEWTNTNRWGAMGVIAVDLPGEKTAEQKRVESLRGYDLADHRQQIWEREGKPTPVWGRTGIVKVGSPASEKQRIPWQS